MPCRVDGEACIVGVKPAELHDLIRVAWLAMEVNFRDFLAESLPVEARSPLRPLSSRPEPDAAGGPHGSPQTHLDLLASIRDATHRQERGDVPARRPR